VLGALAVQLHLDQRLQPADRRGRQQRDAALDDATVAQAAHAAQRRGRRDVDGLGQVLVGHGGVTLQEVEQLEVDAID
jgi:hypothetical protein